MASSSSAMSTTSPSGSELRRQALAEAHVTYQRVILITAVLRVVKNRRLAAAEVTRVLGVPAERVSALLHHDIEPFTVDDLVRMLACAEVEVELTKSTPVDEEVFDGPLCRASGRELYGALHSRLSAM